MIPSIQPAEQSHSQRGQDPIASLAVRLLWSTPSSPPTETAPPATNNDPSRFFIFNPDFWRERMHGTFSRSPLRSSVPARPADDSSCMPFWSAYETADQRTPGSYPVGCQCSFACPLTPYGHVPDRHYRSHAWPPAEYPSSVRNTLRRFMERLRLAHDTGFYTDAPSDGASRGSVSDEESDNEDLEMVMLDIDTSDEEDFHLAGSEELEALAEASVWSTPASTPGAHSPTAQTQAQAPRVSKKGSPGSKKERLLAPTNLFATTETSPATDGKEEGETSLESGTSSGTVVKRQRNLL